MILDAYTSLIPTVQRSDQPADQREEQGGGELGAAEPGRRGTDEGLQAARAVHGGARRGHAEEHEALLI